MSTADLTDQESMRERIEELISSGTIVAADEDVVLECAKRYVALEHAKRGRASSRSVESFHKIATARRDKLRSKVAAVVTALAADVLNGWAPELLAVTFALGDGTEVTFADATVEQHAERASWLEAHAAGTLETASIHRRAIADILAGHAETLGGVVDALVC